MPLHENRLAVASAARAIVNAAILCSRRWGRTGDTDRSRHPATRASAPLGEDEIAAETARSRGVPLARSPSTQSRQHPRLANGSRAHRARALAGAPMECDVLAIQSAIIHPHGHADDGGAILVTRQHAAAREGGLNRAQAAICKHRRGCDERRQRAGAEQDGARDVVWMAEPIQWYAAAHACLHLQETAAFARGLALLVKPWSLRHAGRNRNHAHTFGS